MVHLNLAIALLFALIVFVSGVETAKNHRVRVIIQSYVCVTQIIFNDIFRLAVYWSPQSCTTCFWLFFLGHYVKASVFTCGLWQYFTKEFSNNCVFSYCLVGVSCAAQLHTVLTKL